MELNRKSTFDQFTIYRQLNQINSDVKAAISDITTKQGKYYLLNQQIQDTEIAQDRGKFTLDTSD